MFIQESMARFVMLINMTYDVMARMETHKCDNMCLLVLHDKSMAEFVVINNVAFDCMANEKFVVLSTNIPFIPIYGFWNGTMHECNYSQRFYTVVHDTVRHAS
jgi:hypothetical protein